MKKMNLSMLAILLGTALAVAGSKSITLSTSAQAPQWFYLTPGTDPSNPNNYRAMEQEDECVGTQERCAIFAEEDSGLGKPTQSGVDNPILEEFRAVTR